MTFFAPLCSHRLLLAAAIALTFSACTRQPVAPEPVRAVKLVTVGASPATAALEYAGEVRARTESSLGFRVAGKLVQRHVEVGQQVQAGQLLAQLDGQDYALAAQAAQAQVAAAATQRDLAAADLQRYQALKDRNFISAAELDRRQASARAAQAQLDQARANASAQSNQSGYTRLVADVAGVVTAVHAEPGQVVSAGAPVVHIAQDGARDVVFSVPEDQRGQLRIGQSVQVRPWSAVAAPWAGAVREIAASADAATRTYAVKAALQTAAGAAEMPALGSTVHVRPEGMGLVGESVIKLPTTAVREHNGQSAVWVYDAKLQAVHSQPVVVATADGNDAVIAQGLQPGAQVVATGVHVLSEGQRVTVYEDKYTEKSKLNSHLERSGKDQSAIEYEVQPAAVNK